ncbi:hypothetical protein, partial [Ensifer sp. ENS10]|uniref:hypothetical protein n=1 Tax=Ensifer sp. ENS10 TaxID=2769286 RepID=UPI001AED2FD8
HVLSLPPAFVLSQDQTLKLRIQSLALRHVLNRRELTPFFNQHQSENRHQENRCSLLLKRDRQSLFPKEPFRVPHELRRPRFSFSIFNCQKTDELTVRQTVSNKPETRASDPKISLSQPGKL